MDLDNLVVFPDQGAIPMKKPSIEGLTHHRARLNGTDLHYVAAGDRGSPILLVHGFPETWWTFHKLIPMLAETHRVFAVDLRGFGDSSNDAGEYGSQVSAEDLHELIAEFFRTYACLEGWRGAMGLRRWRGAIGLRRC